MKKHYKYVSFRGGSPPPTPENMYKNMGIFLFLPTPIVWSGEELPQDLKKKKDEEVFNLISFELGALGGKLTLILVILNLFYKIYGSNGASLPLTSSRSPWCGLAI